MRLAQRHVADHAGGRGSGGQSEAAEGSGAPVASPAALDGDVDMDADPAQAAKSVRGPNQYKCAIKPA